MVTHNSLPRELIEVWTQTNQSPPALIKAKGYYCFTSNTNYHHLYLIVSKAGEKFAVRDCGLVESQYRSRPYYRLIRRYPSIGSYFNTWDDAVAFYEVKVNYLREAHKWIRALCYSCFTKDVSRHHKYLILEKSSENSLYWLSRFDAFTWSKNVRLTPGDDNPILVKHFNGLTGEYFDVNSFRVLRDAIDFYQSKVNRLVQSTDEKVYPVGGIKYKDMFVL